MKCTDENINNALFWIHQKKETDMDSGDRDEKIAQLMILSIEEGFKEALLEIKRRKHNAEHAVSEGGGK